MAITGISAISGEQIIAAGAVSAKEAGKASFTTGGNNIQSLYDTVSTNSASWTGGTTGDYISAKGFSQRISNAAGDKFLSFWNEAGGSTATAYPVIYLSGQFGSAYYKDNELKLGRNNHNIAFNIGGQGPKISAGATGTIPSYMYIYNAGNSATISQSGLNLSNSTANENVTIASIQSWNAKGDMHESSFNYDADNKISGYNGSAFATGSELPTGVMVESGLEYNAVNEISGYSGSAFAQYGADKQWLVHDDTLVHAANSAQYALGVNLSAVAQLLGEYPISITESGVYTLNSTYISGTSYLYWYYLSNGMCRIKGQLRPTTAMPATWHSVQIASNGASALMDNTYIPTLIDWEGWVDYLSWFSDGTLNFNSREVSPTAASRLIYVDYLGIPKR